MVVMPKAMQGTVPSAQAPSAEACFSEQCKKSLLYLFYVCGASMAKQDPRSFEIMQSQGQLIKF